MSITLAKILLIVFGEIGLFLSIFEIVRILRIKIDNLLLTTMAVIGLALSIFSTVLGLVI